MLGFRNPFRFAFDSNSAKTRFFVNDTGANHWEEVDKAVKGANYGWNVGEGPCVAGSATDCGPPPPGMTNPIFSYSHAAGCGAITGGAFVPAGIWGSAYDGGYFYADFVCGQISVLKEDHPGHWATTPFATGIGVGGPVAMMFRPHAGATSLYYTSLANHGEVHVIEQS
jgi:glucose/arabinose dehydrogenase